MTALPAKTSFTDSSVTEGGFKTAMDSLRDFLAEQLGATGTDPGGSILRNRRNAIINGNFDLWQRGTSFSTTDDVYTADRWMLDGANGTNGTFTVTQQSFALGQTDVPYEPIYYLEWDQTVAPSAAHTLEQRIESVRTFAGQEVTLSFYAKLVSGTFPLDIDLVQSFGTGGSPSSDNTESVVAAGSLTSSWAKYTYTVTLDSISGKTLGTNGDDYLSLVFNTPASGTWELEVAQVQLEKGSIASPFEQRSVGEELRLAQRYGQIIRVNVRAVAQASSEAIDAPANWPTMRATPTQSVHVAGGSANLSGSLTMNGLTPHGGRFSISSSSTGDCYYLDGDIFLDAEL